MGELVWGFEEEEGTRQHVQEEQTRFKIIRQLESGDLPSLATVTRTLGILTLPPPPSYLALYHLVPPLRPRPVPDTHVMIGSIVHGD